MNDAGGGHGGSIADRRHSQTLPSQPSLLSIRRRPSVLSLQPSTNPEKPKSTSPLSACSYSQTSPTSSGNTTSPPTSATSSSTSWAEAQARRASVAGGAGAEDPLSPTGTGGERRSSQYMFDEIKGPKGSAVYEEGVQNIRRNSLRQQLEERRASLRHARSQDNLNTPSPPSTPQNQRHSISS